MMKKLLVIASLVLATFVVHADCVTNTIIGKDGRMTVCTTCCNGGYCTTTCI